MTNKFENFIDTVVADLRAVKWKYLTETIVADLNKAAAFADAILAADPAKGPAFVALQSAIGIIQEATAALDAAMAAADAVPAVVAPAASVATSS